MGQAVFATASKASRATDADRREFIEHVQSHFGPSTLLTSD